MDKGTQLYKDFIDELVDMSRDCADAAAVKAGNVPLTDVDKIGMNEILAKLNGNEREILSKYIVDAYHSGIYDTLDKLAWMHSCKNMVITVEGETLPLDRFEGMPCDYIGRRLDWEWPE